MQIMFIAKPKKLLVVFYFNQPIKKKKQALSDSLSITFNIISDAGIPISLFHMFGYSEQLILKEIMSE